MAQLKAGTTIGGYLVLTKGNVMDVLAVLGGSGSGLDADTLDGKHASDFSLSNHNHDSVYVKLSGSTMTGPLNLTNAAVNPNFGETKKGSDEALSFPEGLSIHKNSKVENGWASTYSTTLNVKADGTVDRQFQLSGTTGNKLFFRASHSSNAEQESKWFSWARVYTTLDKPTLDELGASSYADGIQRWNSTIKCATWSRLFELPVNTDARGNSIIINIMGTRASVVYNVTLQLTTSHSSKAYITQLNNTSYSNIKVRFVSQSNGGGYLEMYDDANSATSATSQIVQVSVLNMSGFTLNKYTSFTDGTTIPSGYTSSGILTTVSGNTFVGNLSGTASNASKVEQTLTRGSYLTGNNYNGSAATTWAVDATSSNTAGKVVARDSNGDFSARLISASALVTTNIRGSGNILFTDTTGTNAQKICTGGVLISSVYGDVSKVPTNGLFATGNIITRGNVGVGYTHSDTTSPLITLALGDSDTGFKWIKDGEFDVYSDNISVFKINKHSTDAEAGVTFFKPLNIQKQIKSTVATGTAPFTVASNTVVTNLNSDLLDGLHSTSFMRTDTPNSNLTFTNVDGVGIKFWTADTFRIYMSTATNSSYGGRMTGETTSDYNMYFRMGGGTNRGFVFKNGTASVAGIDSGGNIRAKGSISGGDNKFELKYNEEAECLDFVFN